MKKIVLILLVLLSTVSLATSQTEKWLPVEGKLINNQLCLDSSAIYNIAENKRALESCARDMVIQDSIISSQQKIISILEFQVYQQQQEIIKMTVDANKKSDKLSKCQRNRITYVIIGAATGIITYILLI